VSPLEPIALVYEREGLPRFELPLELHRLHGQLLSARLHGSHLFLRYRLARAS
jgi:hypothetical protein